MYIDVRDNVLMTVLRHWYRKKKKKNEADIGERFC